VFLQIPGARELVEDTADLSFPDVDAVGDGEPLPPLSLPRSRDGRCGVAPVSDDLSFADDRTDVSESGCRGLAGCIYWSP
jgi:hypothetical protein